MKKNKTNNTQQLSKKVLVAGKVYDLQTMDKSLVEASVQAYLDSTIGKDKVRFELYTIGNMAAMFFHRGFDYTTYNADPVKDIMDADAFMLTAHGYNGFWMPRPFPVISGCAYPYRIRQMDFLDAYRESAKTLGASNINDAWLDITPQSVIFRIQVK